MGIFFFLFMTRMRDVVIPHRSSVLIQDWLEENEDGNLGAESES